MYFEIKCKGKLTPVASKSGRLVKIEDSYLVFAENLGIEKIALTTKQHNALVRARILGFTIRNEADYSVISLELLDSKRLRR